MSETSVSFHFDQILKGEYLAARHCSGEGHFHEHPPAALSKRENWIDVQTRDKKTHGAGRQS